MKILVKVTRDVLEISKMCDDNYGSNCAIAVAVRDLFPFAEIGESMIDFLHDGGKIDIRNKTVSVMPDVATDFILLFDELEPEQRVLMSPFSFEIEVPEYVIQKIGIGQIYKVLSESSTLEMVM